MGYSAAATVAKNRHAIVIVRDKMLFIDQPHLNSPL